jgi:hypothetical protein
MKERPFWIPPSIAAGSTVAHRSAGHGQGDPGGVGQHLSKQALPSMGSLGKGSAVLETSCSEDDNVPSTGSQLGAHRLCLPPQQ